MDSNHSDHQIELYALYRLHEAILCQYTEDLILFKQLTPKHFTGSTTQKLFTALYAAYEKHGDQITTGHIDDSVREVMPERAGYAWLSLINNAPFLGAPYQIVARLNECLAMREATAFRANEKIELSGQFIGKGEELRSLLSDPLHVTDEQILERLVQEREVVKTGYMDMDRLLGGGIELGAVFVIAARTGIGKTTLGINICARIVHSGKSAFFLSLEMPEEGIYERMLQCFYNITREEVKIHAKELSLKSGFRVSMGSARLPKLLGTLHENSHHDIIVVDYFQLIAARGETQVQQLELVSNELKRFALEYRKPIVVLAQLNRNIESDRVNREPELADIRGCGALEQDAHTVTFLWDANAKQEHKPADKSERRQVLPEYWWIVRKNRNGPCGKFRLNLDTDTMCFTAVAANDLPDL